MLYGVQRVSPGGPVELEKAEVLPDTRHMWNVISNDASILPEECTDISYRADIDYRGITFVCDGDRYHYAARLIDV